MSRRTQKNVGVIGLGIIGSRVAENVRGRGFHVFVWNRTPRPFPNFVGSRSEVAELCDFIQIFVSDDDALLESIDQIKRSLKAHHVVMAHSTVAPHTMREAAEIVQRRGAQFLDAPFTGSKAAAEKGELVYYVSGEAAAFQRARPVLEASSKEIVEVGDKIGQATIVKVATNMITATTVQAAAEALALVHKAGLSPDIFAVAMRGNGSQSATLAMKLPNMISGDFETHFSTKHMLKDVDIASRLARSSGLNFGATEAARDSLRSEAEAGRGDYDYCSLVRIFFPDGIGKTADAETGEEGQQSLAGLDEGTAADSSTEGFESASESTDTLESTGHLAESSTSETTPHEESSDQSTDAHETEEGVAVVATSDSAAIAKSSDGPEPECSAAVGESRIQRELSEEAGTNEYTADEGAGTRKEGSASPPPETEPVAPAGAIGQEILQPRRGLLSRMFGRGFDY